MSDPARDALRAAFSALMKGDLAERDRQCKRAEQIIRAQSANVPIKLVRLADGTFVPEIKANA